MDNSSDQKNYNSQDFEKIMEGIYRFVDHVIDKLLSYNKIIVSVGYFSLFTTIQMVNKDPSSCLLKAVVGFSIFSVFVFIFSIFYELLYIQRIVKGMKSKDPLSVDANSSPDKIKEDIDKYLKPLMSYDKKYINFQYGLFFVYSLTGLIAGLLLILMIARANW